MPRIKRFSSPENSGPVLMEDRKIIKETRKVRVRLPNRQSLDGTVFLGLYEASHIGPQKVGDLLNAEESFIPIKTASTLFLVNVSQIAFVQTTTQWEADELMTLGDKCPVTLKIIHGELLKGDIYINLPEEFRRVKDYFNHAPRFFPLFQKHNILYINRNFVVSVRD